MDPHSKTLPVKGCIEIYWITSGTLLLTSEEQCLQLNNHTILCLKSERVYKVLAEEGTEGYVIRFDQSLLYCQERDFDFKYQAALYQLLENVSVLPVKEKTAVSLAVIGELLLEEYEGCGDFRMQLVSQLLNTLLVFLVRKTKEYEIAASSPSRNILVHKFNTLLEQHYKNLRKVSDYASQLLVTPNYLNEVIKQATGYPAGYHIRQRIIMEAIRQARFTGASMKEVAWRLGFADLAHFSKFFKKETGKTFSDFRRQEMKAALHAA